MFTWWKGRSDWRPPCRTRAPPSRAPQTLLTPGAQLDAYRRHHGQEVWVWGIPNDTAISPTVTYMYKGKQYLATYHGVGAAGFPGSTPTGQRDQLTVFSL